MPVDKLYTIRCQRCFCSFDTNNSDYILCDPCYAESESTHVALNVSNPNYKGIEPDEVETSFIEDVTDMFKDQPNPAEREIDNLADYILREYKDEPGSKDISESAADIAIRLLKEYKPIYESNRLKSSKKGRKPKFYNKKLRATH